MKCTAVCFGAAVVTLALLAGCSESPTDRLGERQGEKIPPAASPAITWRASDRTHGPATCGRTDYGPIRERSEPKGQAAAGCPSNARTSSSVVSRKSS